MGALFARNNREENKKGTTPEGVVPREFNLN